MKMLMNIAPSYPRLAAALRAANDLPTELANVVLYGRYSGDAIDVAEARVQLLLEYLERLDGWTPEAITFR